MMRITVLAGLCLILTIGCKNDDVMVMEDLDIELTSLLNDAGGIEAYLIPDSDDFGSIPQDPNNPLTSEKVTLGQMLYHETAMAIHPKDESGRMSYSCASCHHAQAGFQAGRIQGIADGGWGFGTFGDTRDASSSYDLDSLDVQPIRTPTVLNGAYQEVMLWNGQFGATGINAGTEAQWTPGTPKEVNTLGFEGLETQAIAGLTVHRMGVDSIATMEEYRMLFDAAFPESPEPDRISLENAGLAIGAYERTILANKAPFQQWLRGNSAAMTDQEKQGAIVFFGKAGCGGCHNGPALNSLEFHCLGLHDFEGPGIYGNIPDDATRKGRGGFTGNPADNYKFKVPQLYSLRYSPFYGHSGRFTTLRQIVEYKNDGIAENAGIPPGNLAHQFGPLGLSEAEMDDLVAFLDSGLDDNDLARYVPSSLPSGLCFPNNDEQSRLDLGCN